MRLRTIRTVFVKECREMLRDRRSLAIMFGIPLVLYPLLTVLVATIGLAKTKQLTEQPVRIAVINPAGANHLMELIREPASNFALPNIDDPEAALASGAIDAILEIPATAEHDALAGKPQPFRVRLDRSRTASMSAERRIDRVMDRYEHWAIERRLASRGVEKSVLAPLPRQVQDISTGDQRMGRILSLTLPVLLLVTGMLGAFFPALNATTTERELGTLETLLVTPANRLDLLIAKWSFVLMCALLTAGLNLMSMSLVLWRSLSAMQMEKAMGALTISPRAIALTYVAAIPTLITFTTLVIILGLLARNFREANALATPVMMIPLVAMVVGVMEPALSPGLLITPVANTTLIIREVLVGRVNVGPFVLAFASSCVWAGLLLGVAARVFHSEQLVNPAWEPISFRGLGRRGAPHRRRLPAPDEAIAVFAIALLLVFYITPSLAGRGLIQILIVTELLIALPALGMAWLGRYDFVAAFSWRLPGHRLMLAGLLIGLGMVPWVDLATTLQAQVWPPSAEYLKSTSELLLRPLAEHPILLPLAVGALAGVCEELLFRGPIQAGLIRRLPPGIALALGGLLFAGMHLDAWGMPVRFGLGLMLGWIVLRTGSIFPAMLAHGVYDAAKLFIASWMVHREGVEQVIDSAGKGAGEWSLVQLLAGTAMLALAWMLLQRGKRQVTF